MACYECRCNLTDDVDFEYCGYSMCSMPVCSNCAVLHALKESFQNMPISDKEKNRFYHKVLEEYKNLLEKK